jgi:hypothetical protein
VYRIVLDHETEEQISALPYEALAPLAEVLDVIALAPWNGDPLNRDKPDTRLRTWPFGRAGLLTYLIFDDQQRVDLIRVVWVA